MQYQSIVEDVKQMEARWKDVQVLTDKENELSEEDKINDFLDEFYSDAEKKTQEIKDGLGKIDKDYVARYYGETPDKSALIDFVETFSRFKKDLFESEKIWKEWRRKKFELLI